MKYIDFYIQSALIAIALVLSVLYLIYPDVFSLVAIDQFLIGTWQFAGAIISLILQKRGADLRRKYVSISSIYLISLYVLFRFFTANHFSWAGLALGIYFLVPAWILALYYYYITWRLTFARSKQSSFLPHISF